jgi:cytochrome b561
LRVIWRIARPPLAASGETGWTYQVARANHLLLYVLMVVVPVLGWANASARNWSVGLTPWFALPSIMTAGAKIGPLVGDIHGWLAEGLAVLAGLHVLAGLFHHFVRKDETLRRMW